jgi:glycopeptide antibiotics resistance protein
VTIGRPAADVAPAGRPPHLHDGAVRGPSRPVPAPEHPRARLAARAAYVAVVLFATLANLDAQADLRIAGWRLYRALNPSFGAADAVDAARNVVLFAGLGAVWVVTARTLRVWPAVWRATAVGLALSVCVETVQLFSTARFASALDVLTNGLGAFIGAAALAVVTRVAAAARARPSILPPPAMLVAGPYLAAALLDAFSPPDRPDRVPGTWGGLANRLRIALEHARGTPALGAPWSDVLLVAPAGVLAVLLLVELGVPPLMSGWIAAVGGAALFALAELARGASGGDVRPLAVVAHAAAVAAGAAIGAVVLHAWARGHRAPQPVDDARTTWWPPAREPLGRLVVGAYLFAVVCWSARPFVPVRSLAASIASVGRDQLVPLRSLAQTFSLHSVADVGVGFLLYVPVGAWLAARPLRRRGPLATLLPGLYLAVATEVLQLGVFTRVFDVTDVLVQCAGVCVGWVVLRRADRLAAAIHGARSAG